MHNTPQSFRLVWASSRPAAILGIILMLIAAFLPASQAWVGKLIIDAIVNVVQQGLTASAGLRMVMPFLLMEFALVLIGSISGQVRNLSDRIL